MHRSSLVFQRVRETVNAVDRDCWWTRVIKLNIYPGIHSRNSIQDGCEDERIAMAAFSVEMLILLRLRFEYF
jgi:hypothetical protein